MSQYSFREGSRCLSTPSPKAQQAAFQSMLAAWVTLANLMQCSDMRRLRDEWGILTRQRKYSQIAASTLF